MSPRPDAAQRNGHHALRGELLDAAGRLLEQAPWSQISMASIASEAGVSRQSLYNEFGSRENFTQAFALRAADRFLSELEAAFAANSDDPLLALENGFCRFLELAADDPLVHQIVVRDPGADELFSYFTTRGGPVVEMGAARLTGFICDQWPGVSESAAATLSEGLMRLGISHAGLPTGSRERSARTITELLGPFIEQHLPERLSGRLAPALPADDVG